MSIVAEIKKDKLHVFRRLYFKRRLSGGDYETDWQEIDSALVKSWGTITYSVDDVVPNFIKQGSVSLILNNVDGFFSDVSEEKSFFYTSITRYRTLVKIEAGYIDEDGTEYPTDPSLFTGIITKDAKYKEDNLVGFTVLPLTQIFEEFPADQLRDMRDISTASELIIKIRDHKQTTTGDAIFQKYIASGDWNFSTSSQTYDFETSSSLSGKTLWKLLQDIAVAEDKVVYIDRVGDFYFYPKTASGTASYHFSGIGDTDKTYGHNIVGAISVDENIRKVYNRVSVNYVVGGNDTTTTRNEVWDWGDSSSSFYYGIHSYKYDNTFICDNTTAESVRDSIYTEYVWPKEEIQFTAKFVPQVETEDRCSITYKSKRYEGGYLWGVDQWNQSYWGERLGYNILLNSTTARIIKISHNLNKFVSKVTMRGVD